jgi:hypothetical protein
MEPEAQELQMVLSTTHGSLPTSGGGEAGAVASRALSLALAHDDDHPMLGAVTPTYAATSRSLPPPPQAAEGSTSPEAPGGPGPNRKRMKDWEARARSPPPQPAPSPDASTQRTNLDTDHAEGAANMCRSLGGLRF